MVGVARTVGRGGYGNSTAAAFESNRHRCSTVFTRDGVRRTESRVEGHGDEENALSHKITPRDAHLCPFFAERGFREKSLRLLS